MNFDEKYNNYDFVNKDAPPISKHVLHHHHNSQHNSQVSKLSTICMDA